jgi:N6-adenosine-specific RNA methylase IME4
LAFSNLPLLPPALMGVGSRLSGSKEMDSPSWALVAVCPDLKWNAKQHVSHFTRESRRKTTTITKIKQKIPGTTTHLTRFSKILRDAKFLIELQK